MTKHGSFLMEKEGGLSVCRPLKSLKFSVFPAEELDEFISLLNCFVAAEDYEDAIRHWWERVGHAQRELFIPKIDKARNAQKAARRALIKPLKALRSAPANNLDDILFKAEICAVLEPRDVKGRNTLPTSIINDLLSAGCTWMQEENK
jgi:hypothetical protein